MATYNLGDRVKVYTSTPFYDVAGEVDIDPTTVTFTITTPAGVSTAYVYGVDAIVLRAATGDYSMLLNANAAGEWHYKGTGVDASGNYMGASRGLFTVLPARV